MHPPGASTVIVRHRELYTKSPPVKRRMEGVLVKNLEAMLAARDLEARVELAWNRLFVHADEETVAAVAEVAADTIGVASASPAIGVPPEEERINEVLAETARIHYDGGTFAVDARRASKDHPFTSDDLARAGGDAVWRAVEDEFTPVVDLDDPDYTFGIEVHEDVAYVYVDRLEGPGGLPVGTQAPVVALVSGGIDSPVAAYEAMRRGSPVIPTYVDLGDFGGPDHAARAAETVRTLSRYAPNHDMRVREVPGGETVGLLVETMERGRMLALRRFFFQVAEHVAHEEGAVGIVTGEAIGQKSSQTMANLAATSAVTTLPIHRPLLTMDKEQIVERAREIGTFTDSTIEAGCNRVAPDRVETEGDEERIRDAEPADLTERAVAAAKAVRLVDEGQDALVADR